MTRQDFIDNITIWSELISFCSDEDISDCEDVYYCDDMDDSINDSISDTDRGWRDLRDLLQDIDTGYDYYRCDGAFDWVGLDDGDLDSYKNDIIERFDDDGRWDEPDEDDEETEYDDDDTDEEQDEDDEDPIEDEEFSVKELYDSCSEKLQVLCSDNENEGFDLETLLF